MEIQIIQVPYDSGHEAVRTGKGPACLIDNGLESRLSDMGHGVHVSGVKSMLDLPTENGTTFDTMRLLTGQVRSAVRQDRFPLVLAGNCNSCVGALGGLDGGSPGIIWFDAHGDFNTPETTTSGFLDGMGLAMANGRCWSALMQTIPGFRPVADDCIVHVGSRDLDPQEKTMFDAAGIPLVLAEAGDDSALLTDLNGALARLRTHVNSVYLHIDVDVLDGGLGKPNHLAVPGGMHLQLVEAAIDAIGAQMRIAACTVASYDPKFDVGDSVSNSIFHLIAAVVTAVGAHR
jgi:arginase